LALQVFPVGAACNLTWREDPAREVASFSAPRGKLLRAGAVPAEPLTRRKRRSADFSPFRGIRFSDLPGGRRA